MEGGAVKKPIRRAKRKNGPAAQAKKKRDEEVAEVAQAEVSALISKMNVEEPEDDEEEEMDEEDEGYLEDEISDDGEYGELCTKDRLSDSELEDAFEDTYCDTKEMRDAVRAGEEIPEEVQDNLEANREEWRENEAWAQEYDAFEEELFPEWRNEGLWSRLEENERLLPAGLDRSQEELDEDDDQALKKRRRVVEDTLVQLEEERDFLENETLSLVERYSALRKKISGSSSDHLTALDEEVASLGKTAGEAPTEQTLQRMKEVVEELTKLHPDISLDEEEDVTLQIQQEQRNVGLIFNKRSFSLLCRQIASDYNSNIKWDSAAFEALQTAAESYLVDLFAGGRLVGMRGNEQCTDVLPGDLQLVEHLNGTRSIRPGTTRARPTNIQRG